MWPFEKPGQNQTFPNHQIRAVFLAGQNGCSVVQLFGGFQAVQNRDSQATCR